MQFLRRHWGVFVIILLSILAIKPLLLPGFFPIHDDTQVARAYEMWKALRDGMFPVRWVPDLGYGYGYPIFNFYAPLAYYVGASIMFIGFDVLVATKLMMILGILLSGIFMYMLAREFWGEFGGAISGLLYVFAPYHAVQIYIRGDVTEFWAYAMLPLMALGFYKVFIYSKDNETKKENSKFKIQNSKLQLEFKNKLWMWVIVAGIGYAGIILSHNLTAMMVTPFLVIVLLLFCSIVVYRTKRLSAIYFFLFAITLGLLLSAFYWFPALLEMQYTDVTSQIGDGAYFADHFVCIWQLWDSHWGFGGSAPGCIDGISFKIGKLHLLLTLLVVFIAIVQFKKNKVRQNNILLFVLSFFGLFVSVFFMLNVSKNLWEGVPFMAYFQYPWRFLLLASFFTSLLSGALMAYLKEKTALIFGVIIILLLIVFNVKLFSPQTILPYDTSFYIDKQALLWRTSKISDEFMPKNFEKPKTSEDVMHEKIVIIAGTGKVTDLVEKTQKMTFGVDALTDVNVLVRIAPFPAWEVTVNGGGINAWDKNNGIFFSLPHGKHTVSVEYKETTVEGFGNLLSLIGIALLIVGIMKAKRQEQL